MNHSSNNTQAVKLTGEEIAKHNSRDSCWVIVHGRAYDVTEFLPEHPGGPKIILKYAGKDATEQFYNLHRHAVIQKYSDLQIGTIQGEQSKVLDPVSHILALEMHDADEFSKSAI